MPRFTYTACSATGATVSDALEAGSRQDALRRLGARGLRPLRLTAASAPKKPKKTSSNAASAPSVPQSKIGNPKSQTPTLSRRHRLPFLEALHDLTSSGLSAGEAVRLLALRINEPALRTLCGGLWDRLSEGIPLSRALGEFPAVFDEASLNLLEAGESVESVVCEDPTEALGVNSLVQLAEAMADAQQIQPGDEADSLTQVGQVKAA